jgi:hypothetical protein
MSHRDEQAAALVTEALTQGRIVKAFGPDGDYTVGPYHTATGPASFALFGYGSEVPAAYQQRQGAAVDVARAFVACVGSGRAREAARAPREAFRRDSAIMRHVQVGCRKIRCAMCG